MNAAPSWEWEPTPIPAGGERPYREGVGRLSLPTRIFISNAVVVGLAALVLILSPASVSAEAQLKEVVVIVGGFVAILLIDLAVLRRAFAPLGQLTAAMRSVEPLRPGKRVPVYGADAEIVELTHTFNEMLDRLEHERRDTVRRSLEAQEGERMRIAQELHDEVGQSLTAVTLQLERLSRIVPPEVAGELEEARETARASMEEVRSISKRLRPEALDNLGLASALEVLADRMSSQIGVPIERDIEGRLPAVGPEVDIVVYRVAQEALTNAARHSGASAMRVALAASGGCLSLAVTDDGMGIGDAAPGAGVLGMRERALMVGAELEVDGGPGGGTAVRLRVPLGAERP
jgi:two-component system sensor histidine kinase UhpB